MKKILSVLLVVVGIFVLAGCENEQVEKTLICTRTATISDGVKADLRYEVNYKGDYVTTLKSTEKIISDNEEYLNTYKETIESTYEPYKDIEYYDYEVTVEGDTMTSSVNVDYSKIDTNKLLEIDSANGSLIKDGKIKIDDIKSLYESVGTTCK